MIHIDFADNGSFYALVKHSTHTRLPARASHASNARAAIVVEHGLHQQPRLLPRCFDAALVSWRRWVCPRVMTRTCSCCHAPPSLCNERCHRPCMHRLTDCAISTWHRKSEERAAGGGLKHAHGRERVNLAVGVHGTRHSRICAAVTLVCGCHVANDSIRGDAEGGGAEGHEQWQRQQALRHRVMIASS